MAKITFETPCEIGDLYFYILKTYHYENGEKVNLDTADNRAFEVYLERFALDYDRLCKYLTAAVFRIPGEESVKTDGVTAEIYALYAVVFGSIE